ncbi:MAG: hypothetical protein JXL81_06985 [Deltaproteobacteria bacterium]|nr:hypothetical protein [Deltaproteobacteria bacterium]
MLISVSAKIWRMLVLFTFVISLYPAVCWAEGASNSGGIFTFFENHFGLLCLIWLIFLVVLSFLSWSCQDSLIGGNTGSRLFVSFLVLINIGFIISPSLMPKSPAWWYSGILIILAIFNLYLAFTAISIFLFKSYEEETGRESKWFSTVVHFDVVSGTEALKSGMERLMVMIVFSFLLCGFSYGAHWFLKDYVPKEQKEIASLLEKKSAMLDSYKPEFENSMVILTKDENIKELSNPQSTDNTLDGYIIILNSENYSLNIPFTSTVSMESTNTQVGKYKNTRHYVHNVAYRINNQDHYIKAWCDMSICGYKNPDDPSSNFCVKCDEIVVLKNLAKEVKNYDPKNRLDKGQLYNADITFRDGEKISFSSPMLGGGWNKGSKRFFKVWDGTRNHEVAYDDIASIDITQDKGEDPLRLSVIVTKRSGETISGTHYVDLTSDYEYFTGLCDAGWVRIEVKNISRVDFHGAQNL